MAALVRSTTLRKVRYIVWWISLLIAFPVAEAQPTPSWFAKAPPLPQPTGTVIRVASPDELLAAVDRVETGGTILLADGHYKVPRVIVLDGKKHVTIRSASGDPAKVTLSGKGWDSGN